jgi:competence protein ComEC
MEDATILITGDIGEERQEWIAKRYDLRSVNIYKVSHHGSRSRSPAFDAELNPELALISVGANNPFGHPAPETLDLLAPAQIHRTDRDGGARITWWPLRIH